MGWSASKFCHPVTFYLKLFFCTQKIKTKIGLRVTLKKSNKIPLNVHHTNKDKYHTFVKTFNVVGNKIITSSVNQICIDIFISLDSVLERAI